MMMPRRMWRVFLITGCCLAGLKQVYAGSVYSWVDPDGVTHFSETPPPDPDVRSSTIELAPLPPPADYDDYYSVVRQAERMEKRRLENEKLEAERLLAEAEARRARLATEAATQTPQAFEEENTVYLPSYPYYPGHRAGHGGTSWGPGGPGYRPGRPGYWPDQPGYWPGQPGRPQPRPGPRGPISAIPARP